MTLSFILEGGGREVFKGVCGRRSYVRRISQGGGGMEVQNRNYGTNRLRVNTDHGRSTTRVTNLSRAQKILLSHFGRMLVPPPPCHACDHGTFGQQTGIYFAD